MNILTFHEHFNFALKKGILQHLIQVKINIPYRKSLGKSRGFGEKIKKGGVYRGWLSINSKEVSYLL